MQTSPLSTEHVRVASLRWKPRAAVRWVDIALRAAPRAQSVRHPIIFPERLSVGRFHAAFRYWSTVHTRPPSFGLRLIVPLVSQHTAVYDCLSSHHTPCRAT